MQKGTDGRNAGEVTVATMESGQEPWPRRVNQNSCGHTNLDDVEKRGLSTNATISPAGRGPKGRSDPRPRGL